VDVLAAELTRVCEVSLLVLVLIPINTGTAKVTVDNNRLITMAYPLI
jgi:hypothetical protein